MSKTIVIPADRGNPVFVTVNGRKYSYPAGTEQTVPDEVAALFAANESSNVIYGRVPAGPLSVEEKYTGEDAIPVKATLGGRLVVDAADVVQVATPLITDAVDEWLEEHPEATTTVEDGAITRAKLHEDLAGEIDTAEEDIDDLEADVSGLKSAVDGEDPLQLTGYDVYGYAMAEGGTFLKSGASYKCFAIPRSDLRSELHVTANATLGTYVSFFKTTPPDTSNVANGDSAASYLCANTPARVLVTKGTDAYFDIPTDAAYAIITKHNTMGDNTPKSVAAVTEVMQNAKSNTTRIETTEAGIDVLDACADATETVGTVEIGGINSANGNADDTATDYVRSGFIAVWPGDVVSLSEFGRLHGFAVDVYQYYTDSTYSELSRYIGKATVTDGVYTVENINCSLLRVVIGNAGMTPAVANLEQYAAAVFVNRNRHHFVSNYLLPVKFEDFFESETDPSPTTVTAAEMLAKFDGMVNLFTDEELTIGSYLADDGSVASSSKSAYTDYIPVAASTAYCYHAAVVLTSSAYKIRVHLYDSSKEWISMAGSQQTAKDVIENVDIPFTTTSATAYIRISIGCWGHTTNHVLLKTSAQTITGNGNFYKIASGTDSSSNALAAYRYKPRTKGYESNHIYSNSTPRQFPFPKIMVVGNIHGDEKSPTFSILKLVELLTGNEHVNESVDFIRDNVEIVMVPLSNPSGWNANSYYNGNSENLNRDFPPFGNFSQAETQFIRDVYEAEDGIDFFFDFHNCTWNGPNVSDNADNERSMPQLGYVFTGSPLFQKLGCNIYSAFKTRVNAMADVVMDYVIFCEDARKGTSALWAASQGTKSTLFEIDRAIPNLDNELIGNDVIIFGVNLLCSFIVNSIYTLRLPE